MPKKRLNPIRDAVGSILAEERINHLARELGVVKRQRKVRMVAFVGAVVLGFAAGAQRTLAGMRRAYEHTTGHVLAPSGFYARFNREMAHLIKQLVEDALAQLQQQVPRLKQSLARFEQVLVADGSLIQLHRSLAKHYPSVFPNKVGAAAKLHVVLNVVGRSARSVQIAAGSRHDSKILKVGSWVAGKLLLLDLAYRKGLLYKRIAEHGGYFLLRKKDSDDPVIIDAPWCGQRLSAMQHQFAGQLIDVRARVPWTFDRGPDKRRHLLDVRIVGQWHPLEGRHHFYVTNAPPEMLAANHVGPIYAARWEIELFFRELKLTHRLEELPTRKRFVAEALIYAALLSLLLSRKLRQHVLPQRMTFAPERWARVFATFSLAILDVLLARRQSTANSLRLLRVLRQEAPDPNRKRHNLLQRAQLGVFAPGRA
jgi:IS4 transposase